MALISEIYKYLCDLAPLELQMSFDNSGLQIGRVNREAAKVLLALDVTNDVLDEAVELGANLIVSHHPLIFTALKSINGENVDGERLLQLIEKGITVISMHTNLDITDGGVNDVLMETLGAKTVSTLDRENCGRVGFLEKPVDMPEFLAFCKKKLNSNGLRYYDSQKPVYKIAVMGGAGGDSLEDAYNHGCDTYITSDIKYHQFLAAKDMAMNLIDADHFCTENPVIPALREKLAQEFPETDFIVSKTHKQIISFV